MSCAWNATPVGPRWVRRWRPRRSVGESWVTYSMDPVWLPPGTRASPVPPVPPLTTVVVLSVLLGNGDGTLQPHQDFGAGTESFGVAAADLNGDGKPDMVAADINTSSVNVWLNTSPFAAALA